VLLGNVVARAEVIGDKLLDVIDAAVLEVVNMGVAVLLMEVFVTLRLGAVVLAAGFAVSVIITVLCPPVESGMTVNCTDKAEVISGNKDDATETPAEIKEETSSWRAKTLATKGGTNMMLFLKNDHWLHKPFS